MVYEEKADPLTGKGERHKATAAALSTMGLNKSIIAETPESIIAETEIKVGEPLKWEKGDTKTKYRIYWEANLTPLAPKSESILLVIQADEKKNDVWDIKYAVKWFQEGYSNTDYIKLIEKPSRERTEKAINYLMKNATKYDYTLLKSQSTKKMLEERFAMISKRWSDEDEL